MYIYIYTSVDPRISILVSDEAELRNAKLRGTVTAPADHGTTGTPDHPEARSLGFLNALRPRSDPRAELSRAK